MPVSFTVLVLLHLCVLEHFDPAHHIVILRIAIVELDGRRIGLGDPLLQPLLVLAIEHASLLISESTQNLV